MADSKLLTPELGMQFSTYEEVKEFMNKYSAQIQQVFVHGSSASIEKSYLSGKVDAALHYVHVDYVCKFGKKKVSQRQVRPSSTYDHDCPAFVNFKLPGGKKKTYLEICALDLAHKNHDDSTKYQHAITENRRLSSAVRGKTLEMFAMGAKNKLVKNSLADNHQKFLLQKDISNLKANLKQKDDNHLPKFVNLLEKEYGCTVAVLQDEHHKFRGLYMSTPKMRASLAAWPSILFVDGTYKLFNLGFPLMVLQVQDSEGRPEIVGAAIVASEDATTLKWLAQIFRDQNLEASGRIKCIMTDKDLTARKALNIALPGIPMYICIFHVEKAVKLAVNKMKLDATVKTQVLEGFDSLMYSSSAEQHDARYTNFMATAPEEFETYFNNNWHPIRNEWTVYSMTEGTLGNRTNNQLESMNSQIHDMCQNCSSLCGFARRFFALIQSQTQETDIRLAMKVLKRPRPLFAPGSIQEQYANLLTTLGRVEVHKQLATHDKITLQEINCDTQECHIMSRGTILTVTPQSCTCHFRKSWSLPCRHIFAVRNHFQLSLFDSSLCDTMWTKDFLKKNHRALQSVATPNTLTADGMTSSTLIEKTPRRKIVTAAERRKELLSIGQDLANIGSLTTGINYERKRLFLLNTLSTWKNGRDVDSDVYDHEVIISHQQVDNDAQDGATVTESLKNLSIAEEDITLSEIESIIIPPPIKMRGHPAGTSRNTPTVRGTRKKIKKFSEYPNQQKYNKILEWLLPKEFSRDNIVNNEYLIEIADLCCVSSTDSLGSSRISTNTIEEMKEYFHEDAFHMVKEIISLKKMGPFSCKVCGSDVGEDFVECEGCLLVYDFKCTGLKRHPKKSSWLCSTCK